MSGRGGSFNFDKYFNDVTVSERELPLTEPLVTKCLHVDGFTVNAGADIVHFVGWQTVDALSEIPSERRIVVRFAMSEFEARALKCAMGKALREGY